jgi:hypothetical protein
MIGFDTVFGFFHETLSGENALRQARDKLRRAEKKVETHGYEGTGGWARYIPTMCEIFHVVIALRLKQAELS